MPRVKCPKCATQLAIKQIPESGKVKCPNCATVLSLTAPSAANASAANASSANTSSANPIAKQPVTPKQPAAKTPAAPKPVAKKSSTKKAAKGQPAVGKPLIAQPAVAQPAVAQPAVAQPAVAQPASPVASPAAPSPAVSSDPFDFPMHDSLGGAAQAGNAAAAGSATDAFDFGSLPTGPSPAAGFPAAGFPAAQPLPAASPAAGSPAAGNAATPAPSQSAEDDDDESDSDAKMIRNVIYVSVGIGVFLLFATFIGFTVAMSGGNSKGESSALLDGSTEAEEDGVEVPPGWQEVEKMDVTCVMPMADEMQEIPGMVDGFGVYSAATENYLFIAVEGVNRNREATSEGSRKKTARLVGGEVLGGTPTERNGYQGFQGILDQSLFLPRMQMELLTHDGRFVIVGYSSAMLRGGGAPNAEAQDEIDTFLNSIRVNKRSSGWLF